MSGEYLLFAGQDYYPSGGWSDLIGTYDTLDDARAEAMRDHVHRFRQPAGYSRSFWTASGAYDWAQVVHDGVQVAQFGCGTEPDVEECRCWSES